MPNWSRNSSPFSPLLPLCYSCLTIYSDIELQVSPSLYHHNEGSVYFCLFISDRKALSTFLTRQIKCCWSISAFVYLGKSIFSLHIWRIAMLDRILLAIFNFQYFEYVSSHTWPEELLLRNLLIAYLGFFCRLLSFFPPAAFKILYYWLLTVLM